MEPEYFRNVEAYAMGALVVVAALVFLAALPLHIGQLRIDAAPVVSAPSLYEPIPASDSSPHASAASASQSTTVNS